MKTIKLKRSDSGMATFLGIILMSVVVAYVSAIAIGFVGSLNTYKKTLDFTSKKDSLETEMRLALTYPLTFGESVSLTPDSQEIKLRDNASGELKTYLKSGACYRDYFISKIDVTEARRIQVGSVKSVLGYLMVTFQVAPFACTSANPVAAIPEDVKKGIARVAMFFVTDQIKLSTLPLSQAILEAYSTNLTTVPLSTLSSGEICNVSQYDLANCKTSHEKQCELFLFQDGAGNLMAKHFDPVKKACMPLETVTRI